MITCDKCGKTGDSLKIGTFNVALVELGEDPDDGIVEEINLCTGEDGCHGIVIAELESMVRTIQAGTPKKP